MKNKSLGILAILNSLNTILGMIFPFITYPYVTRVLGGSNLGKINFTSSVISYFAIIAGLGIYTYSVREGSIYKENRNRISKFASEIFTINICSTVIAYLLLLICYFGIQKLHNYSLLIFIQSISIFFSTIGVSWIYVIYEDYIYIVIRNVLFQILSIIMLFIFVKTPDDYFCYALITVISSSGSNIFNFIHSKKYMDLTIKFSKECFKHIKSILIMFASTIASTIYVNSDNVILGFLKGDNSVGLYSVSVKIYSILKTLVNSMFGVALPRISFLISKNNIEEASTIINHMILIVLFFVIPIVVGINIISVEIITIFGGEAYFGAVVSLRILIIAFVFSIFASLFSTLVLLPAKQEKIIMNSSFISGIVNILLNLFFIRIWDLNGAAFTTLLSEMLVFIIYIKESKKHISVNFDWKEIIKICVAALAMIPISIVVKKMCDLLILKTILIILICALSYGLSLIIMKSTSINKVINFMKKKSTK